MKILYQERATGKTSQAIWESHDNNYVIVCNNEMQVGYIKEKAIKMGLTIPNPISLNQLINTDSIRGRKIDGLIFDDAEFALQYIVNKMSGLDTKMITMSIPRRL